MEHPNQVVSTVYRNICAKYGLEDPQSKWTTPPKVTENDQAKILQDSQIETDKMVVAYQLDIVVVNQQDKKVVMVNVTIPADSNNRKKEQEKCQGLKEELDRMQE